MGSDDFKQDRPDQHMQGDLGQRWRTVVIPEIQPAMEQQQRRQSARYQPDVIEVIVQEEIGATRFEYPTIQRVEQATDQK